MKRFTHVAAFLAILVSAVSSIAARPFAAFDNGLGDVPSLEDKAALLKELGFDGIAWRPGRTAEMLAALDRHGLKMFATYVVLQADANKCAVPTNVIAEINALKGRDTIVWLCVNGRSTDDIVLAGVRQLADLAATNGLRVAMYPHFGSYTDTEATAMRLATQSGRTNVGVSFNLCHFLRQNDEVELERTLRDIAPRLFMVSVSGADRGETRKMDWARLIQPLGQGNFDVARLLRVLDQIGYAGPVGLQCYGIKQPAREHLAQSIKAWRAISVKPSEAASVPGR